jgi:hypothetical protein
VTALLPMFALTLQERGDADTHRLEVLVLDVGRDDDAGLAPPRERTSSASRFSRSATNRISSVTMPFRAKCIWVTFG